MVVVTINQNNTRLVHILEGYNRGGWHCQEEQDDADKKRRRTMMQRRRRVNNAEEEGRRAVEDRFLRQPVSKLISQ